MKGAKLTCLCARHWDMVRLDISRGASRAPNFRTFITACTQTTNFDILCAASEDALMQGAQCDVALAGHSGVTSFACSGYLPSSLPPQLTHLYVYLSRIDSVNLGPLALAQLLMRAQLCPALKQISLSTRNFWLCQLSAGDLFDLRIPALQLLHLSVHTSPNTELELDFLSLPRSFGVYFEGVDGWFIESMPVNRSKLLELAQELQAHDCFSAVLCRGWFSQPQLYRLNRLPVGDMHLSLVPQTVSSLPGCPSLELCFGFQSTFGQIVSGRAQLSWPALVGRTGKLTVSCCNFPGSVLRVLDCPPDSTAPNCDEPWRLCIKGFNRVVGLPSACISAAGLHVLQNAAADRAGW